MTIADFLYQASFWQWVGLVILTSNIFSVLSHIMTRRTNFRVIEYGKTWKFWS